MSNQMWYSSDTDPLKGIRGEIFLEQCKEGDIIRFVDGTIQKPINKDFIITSKSENRESIKADNGYESPSLMRHIHGLRILPNGTQGKTRFSLFQVDNVFKDSVTFNFSR